MPYVKFTTGHTKCDAIRRYLEKLGLDYGRYAVERGFSIHGLDRASERRTVAIARNAVDVGDMGELRELSLLVAVCDRYGELER